MKKLIPVIAILLTGCAGVPKNVYTVDFGAAGKLKFEMEKENIAEGIEYTKATDGSVTLKIHKLCSTNSPSEMTALANLQATQGATALGLAQQISQQTSDLREISKKIPTIP